MINRLLIFIAVLSCTSLSAQQKLTLEQCEALFQKNNLLLLAEQYNIDIADANVIQVKIWEQPVLSGEFNAVNPENKKILDIGSNGQKAFAVQQLIYMGGKKKNEVAFARSNVLIAGLQFQQLLVTLKSQLQQAFYTLYFDDQKIRTISSQLSNIDSLTQAYDVQAQKGNVPLKDVVRLQALSLGLKNEMQEIQRNIYEQQEALKILTSSDSVFIPLMPAGLENNFSKQIVTTLEELQNTALQKNAEYLSAKKIIDNSSLYLKWQQSLAVPDITVGSSYDQTGGAFRNQVNLSFGIPLPLWNRNKGNIKSAEKQVAQSKVTADQKANELKAQVATAYNSLLYQQKQYLNISSNTSENLSVVYAGVLLNFQRRNISLIEFTDFMESYNQSSMLLSEMKKQLMLAAVNLNYLVNEKIF